MGFYPLGKYPDGIRGFVVGPRAALMKKVEKDQNAMC